MFEDFDLGAMMQNPMAMGLLATALKGGVDFYQGNQAAKASQDGALMMGNLTSQGKYYDPRFVQSIPGVLNHGGGGMGAASLANIGVDAGMTMTNKQARGLGPQMAQKFKAQGAVAPGLMESFAGALGPGMAMGGLASGMAGKLFKG